MLGAMRRSLVIGLVLAGLLAGSCGSDGPSCDLPEQWSSAKSGDGSLCQVNIYTDTDEYAVYCGGATGSWDCACGAAVDNPDEFASEDFCDLSPEERVCEAIARCNFPL